MYCQGDKNVTTVESRLFWLGLVICPLIWMFFLVAALFSLKFKWLVSIKSSCFLNSYVLLYNGLVSHYDFYCLKFV